MLDGCVHTPQIFLEWKLICYKTGNHLHFICDVVMIQEKTQKFLSWELPMDYSYFFVVVIVKLYVSLLHGRSYCIFFTGVYVNWFYGLVTVTKSGFPHNF